MADTQAPTVSGELRNALNYFTTIRAGLGLPTVNVNNLTHDHLKETFIALGKFDGNFAAFSEKANKTLGVKTTPEIAEFIVNGAVRSMLTMVGEHPSLQGPPEKQQESLTVLMQSFQQQVGPRSTEFEALRAGLGMPEKEKYTTADIKETRAALEAFKKNPNHLDVMTKTLSDIAERPVPRGNVLNIIDGAPKLLGFMEANVDPAPAPAPTAAAPAPATRVYSGRGGTKPPSQEVLVYQAKIEIMSVGLALGHKLKKVEELTPAKIKEITDQVKARKLADGKAATPALYLANFKQNAAEIPDAALKTRIQQGALVGSGRAMPGDTAIPRNIARMEVALAQNVALVTSAAPAPVVAATGAAAPAAGRAAAQAAPAAPPVDKTADIKFVEETLGKMKISVGTVDGKADDAFHKGTTQFKGLLAAIAGVKVSDGVCTPAECDQLLTGLNKFLGDKKQIDALKAIIQGKAPEGMDIGTSEFVEFKLKGKTASERIFWALERQAEEKAKTGDKSMQQALAAMPKEVRDNLHVAFETLQNDGAKLLQSLKVVYTPATAAAPAAPGAAPAAVPGAAPVPAAPPAPAAPAVARDISEDIQNVEFALNKFIAPMLKNVTGMIGKLGFSDSLLPVITQEDLDDKGADGKAVFGAKSQRMTAMTIMVMKEMAGYERADGTYTREIGDDLLMKIMTDDKMKMVRDKVGIQKLTPELAEMVLAKENPKEPEKLAEGASAADKKAYDAELKEYQKVMKLREKADALKKFFDSLNNLHEHKPKSLLLGDDQAASVTKGNMMIDAASAALDKWAPGLKRMLVNFLQNTAIGQMIGGVMGMMGMDVSRLWEKPENHKTPQQVLDNSIIAVSKTFESEFNKAQKELGADAPFATVMAKTKKSITDDMNGWIASTTMKALLPNGSEDDVKKLVQKALEAAEKQKNGVDAQKAFTETLQAGGLQWQKEKKLDFATLDKYVAETRTQVATLQAEGAGFVAPRPPAAPAPASGGGRVDAAPAAAPQPLTREQQMARLKLDEAGMAALEKEQAEWERQRAAKEPHSKSSPMKLAEMKAGVWMEPPAAPAVRGTISFELGEKVVSIIPGSAETASGTFARQLPVRASNGRMGAISEVLYENFDKLGITGIKKEQLLGKDGKPIDGASHAVVQALTELSVRSQLRIDPSKEADPKLTHMTINAYAIAQMQHLGVDPAQIDKAKKAIDSMAVDHASFVGGTKGQKAPAGGWPSVLEQTFAGYVYKVEVKDKPAPVAAPPVAPPAPAAPARPAGPYDGIAVDPKDAAIFDAYKGHNALKGGPNCEPLFFAMDSKGTILSAADYQKKVAQKEDVSDFKAYAALVDQKAKRFEVLSIGDGKDNYIFTRKLPDAVADKIIDNYTIRIKQNGQDVDVGLGKAPTAEQRPLVIAEIKKAIDCALGLQPLALTSEFSGPAQQHRAPVETRTPVLTEQELERQRRAAAEEEAARQRAAAAKADPMAHAREAERRYQEDQRRALAEAYQRRGQAGPAGQFNDKGGMTCTIIDRPNKWNLLRMLGAEGAKITTCTSDVTGYPMGVGGYPGGINIRQQGFSNTVTIGGTKMGD